MEQHFQYCANYLRQHDYGRYIAALYLGEELRRAAFAIYAFNCKISQIPQLVSEPMPGEIRIGWWRNVISGEDDHSGDPVALALQQTVTRYALPASQLDHLLDARIFDLYHDPTADRPTFETYLGQTRSALFHLLTKVASNIDTNDADSGFQDTVDKACDDAGIFCGVVELLKALPEHEHHQRIYFPADISSHPRLMPATAAGDSATLNPDWLGDCVAYALQHYEAAFGASTTLPLNFRMLFNQLALSRLELDDIVAGGINLASRAGQISRLRINWCLWKSSRALGKIQV